jgi:hypothetical protein
MPNRPPVLSPPSLTPYTPFLNQITLKDGRRRVLRGEISKIIMIR